MKKYKGLYLPEKERCAIQRQGRSTIVHWITNCDIGDCLVPAGTIDVCSAATLDCIDCLFRHSNKHTLVDYLLENKCITEGDALQIALDSDTKT